MLDGSPRVYSGADGEKRHFNFRRSPKGPTRPSEAANCRAVYFTFIREPIATFVSGFFEAACFAHNHVDAKHPPPQDDGTGKTAGFLSRYRAAAPEHRKTESVMRAWLTSTELRVPGTLARTIRLCGASRWKRSGPFSTTTSTGGTWGPQQRTCGLKRIKSTPCQMGATFPSLERPRRWKTR